MKGEPKWPRVPKLYKAGTVAIFASGPSLTPEDVEYCRSRVDGAIAINTTRELAPWATVLYAADAKWWKWNKGAQDFQGLRFSVNRDAAKWPGVQILKRGPRQGLSLDPTTLCLGQNSGYQAINVAVLMGATKILLLGYDMQRTNGVAHWHGEHPDKSRSAYAEFLRCYPSLLEPLKAAGVTVVNCSRVTALNCFQKIALEDALR